MVNLNKPPFSKRWLSTMYASKEVGLTLRPSERYSADYLGFSFNSNRHGLRGPSDSKGANVICGTSFAMGVGVDIGQNWYELLDLGENFFNIGFPVSTVNHINRLDALYRGAAENLYFIYHPNIWFTSLIFQEAARRDLLIDEYMRWDKIGAGTLQRMKFSYSGLMKRIMGIESVVNYQNKKYLVSGRYCLSRSAICNSSLQKETSNLRSLFDRFKRVTVIRVPIKEEVLCRHNVYRYEANQEILDGLWSKLCQDVSFDNCIDFSRLFSADDYHGYDNHWNKKGNQTFKRLLVEEGIFR